jgi:hypothetical protein
MSRLAIAVLLGVSGCASNARTPETPHRHWAPAYVFGIWGKADLDARDDCPTSGAADVFIGPTWQTILVSVGTLGMYTPREVRIRCRPQP